MKYAITPAEKPTKALILQGDWEGGISHVAIDMIANGIEVTKVVLNAADWIYSYRKIPTVSFDQPLAEFEAWLRNYIAEHQIDCILIYNQYRPYNQIGWDVAKELGLECLVLELGLLRPDFCTIYSEKFDHFSYLRSEWVRLEQSNVKLDDPEVPAQLAKMKTLTKMKQFAAFFLFSRVMAIFFRKYVHYTDQRGQGFFHHLSALVMSGLRYQGRIKQSRYNEIFATELSEKYYFVPLQVHCDSQILKRSTYSGMEDFIEHVVGSFYKHAPADTKLVLKVHPMDRGYKDYHKKIEEINSRHKDHRVIYIDRVHLPTVLDHCLGCVTVNSSVGLSALIHKKKLVCLGEAAFDLDQLTFQGSLDDFWSADFKPSTVKIKNFINLLKLTSQANGTFFQKLYSTKGHCKINWPTMFKSYFAE